jgi:replication factor C small subunit
MDSWTYKYTPKTIADMVLDENLEALIESYIKKQTFFSCTLVGSQGIGKTTLAKIIPTLIENSNLLYLTTTTDSGVDSIRTKILDYVSAKGFGTIKFVIIDEADRLSLAAQQVLRPLIEECADDTRFILTCNYIGNIIGPIQSRCIPVTIEHTKNKDKILRRLCNILKNENIALDRNILETIKNDIVGKFFPDIRTMINVLETCSITGAFKFQNVVDNTEIQDIAQTILNELTKSSMFELRSYWTEREGSFSKDYSLLAKELFNIIKKDDAMEIIADGLYRMSMSLDKEIQFAGIILKLKRLS